MEQLGRSFGGYLKEFQRKHVVDKPPAIQAAAILPEAETELARTPTEPLP